MLSNHSKEFAIASSSITEQIIDTPWRTINHLRRLMSLPYIRLAFYCHGIKWGKKWRIFGMPILQRHRRSTITLGDQLELRSWPQSNPLAPYHPVVLTTRNAGASLTIGNHCGLTGATVVAAERIEIGDRVLVGANAIIVDTDFHLLDPTQRQRNPHASKHRPTIIEDDVFIGMNSIILKGVTLGSGCVVGAGSVVASNIPAGMIAAGNPAKIVKPVQ